MFVLRRTPNPAADLACGWSAWGGQYEVHPFSLAAVDMLALNQGVDLPDIDDPAEAAEYCVDELDLDVRRCPATGLYALRHHAGLSCYELRATTLRKAIAEAKRVADKGHCNGLTGGVCGLRPRAYHHVRDDWYVFEVEEVDLQLDS